MACRSRYLCLIILVCAGHVFAQTSQYQSDLDALMQKVSRIHKLNASIEKLQLELNTSGQEISRLKTSTDGFFQDLALQKQMQDAQELSNELDKLYSQRAHIVEQFKNMQQQMLREIETDLSRAHLLKKEQTKSLMSLHQQISSIETFATKDKTTLSSFEDPELEQASFQEQWIVLKDLEIYTKDLIEDTKRALAYEKQQTRLKQELTHLLNEEMFFGEQGFIQGTARKQNPLATTAQTENPDNTTPEGESPEMNPENPDPMPEEPIDPDVPIDDPDTIDTGDLTDTVEAFDTIETPNLDEIDPKVQTLMLDSVFPEVNLQDSIDDDPTQGALDPNTLDRLQIFEDPQEIANALLALSPAQGETKQAFLQRKLGYLQDILQKLQQTSENVQKSLSEQP